MTFIYLCKSLLVTHGFHFNIQYLFVYLFKAKSTKPAQVTTCFYLLMEIGCWLHVVFIWIFSIYLFIYSKRCQQKQRKSPPVFIYLCKLLLDYMRFSFEYSVSICLFIQSDVNKSSASHHLFLFTYRNWLLITCGFCFNIQYLFVYLFKAMSTKAGGTDHLFLFTYGNDLLITCAFRFNIQYLFVYLFKAMSTKAGGTDHLFLFTYVNSVLLRLNSLLLLLT